MKKHSLIFAFLITSFFAKAQDYKMQLANSYYDNFHYVEAVEIYEDVIDEDSSNYEAIEKLAHSYRKLHDTNNSEKWYKKLTEHFPDNSLFSLYYAQALASNGKYDESKNGYKKFSKLKSTDSRGEVFVYAYENLNPFYEDSTLFTVKQVDFNTDHSEFSPLYYKSGLLFVSNRETFSLFERVFGWNNTPYLDLFYKDFSDGKISKFSKEINSKYHEGSAVFSKTLDTMYFTRSNYFDGKFKKSDENINKLKLFMAINKNNKWQNLSPFPYNDDQYSVGQPALSADNKTIYFASDMPGSMGGTDIFKCTLDANNQWSKPVNLGFEVNTEGNEMFPYVDSKNTLFFSTDGRGGLGGLDIFFSRFRDGKYETPRNIGYPLSSSKDDFGITVNEDETEGYFSSNRLNNLGDDDIYKFNTIIPISRIISIRSIVMDPLKKPIPAASIVVKNKQSGESTETITNDKGKIEFNFRPNEEYEIMASKNGFKTVKMEVIADSILRMKNNDTIRMLMEPLNFINTAAAKLNNDSISDALALLQKNADKVEKDKKKSTKTIVPEPTKEDTNGVKTEFKLEKDFVIQSIYYNFDKYTIRKDAALQLDHVADIMKQYPDMKVEMYSHTDSRGSNKYNYKLSQKRASASKHYLVKKGISGRRIKSTFYGEKQLTNRCADRVKCTKEEQQQNRRTEFRIISY
jgi:outer membrane protein OmpA-like peptidoglycan-associated protein